MTFEFHSHDAYVLSDGRRINYSSSCGGHDHTSESRNDSGWSASSGCSGAELMRIRSNKSIKTALMRRPFFAFFGNNDSIKAAVFLDSTLNDLTSSSSSSSSFSVWWIQVNEWNESERCRINRTNEPLGVTYQMRSLLLAMIQVWPAIHRSFPCHRLLQK